MNLDKAKVRREFSHLRTSFRNFSNHIGLKVSGVGFWLCRPKARPTKIEARRRKIIFSIFTLYPLLYHNLNLNASKVNC